MEPFQRQGSPGAVAHETFEAGPVVAFDPRGSVHAETAARLPREHLGAGVLAEQAAPLEGAEHAALDGALQLTPVLGREQGGFVEVEPVAGPLLAQDAVEGEDVEVEGRVEAGAKALRKGQGGTGVGMPQTDPARSADPMAGWDEALRSACRE